jgi:hypothetical protein
LFFFHVQTIIADLAKKPKEESDTKRRSPESKTDLATSAEAAPAAAEAAPAAAEAAPAAAEAAPAAAEAAPAAAEAAPAAAEAAGLENASTLTLDGLSSVSSAVQQQQPSSSVDLPSASAPFPSPLSASHCDPPVTTAAASPFAAVPVMKPDIVFFGEVRYHPYQTIFPY